MIFVCYNYKKSDVLKPPLPKGRGTTEGGGGIHTLAYKDTLLLRSNVGDQALLGGGIPNTKKRAINIARFDYI